ncbi:SAM-dependent methyltransferase [Nibrella viscosa]|uniref:SAM-dependent methyltransferase n=1 Tax=Nibrella viscosa TaxID=1084524 RepID=A0ABP8L228_9BACT
MTELTAAEKRFIQQNLQINVQTLLLRKHEETIRWKEVAAQIQARQKAAQKLPTWYANPDLLFPPTLSVEQASSERTARYKASLVNGHRLLDLTGGMGVDSWAFAQRLDQVTYVEQQPALAALAAHNFPILGMTNVEIHPQDGLSYLQSMIDPVDWIYLDPARRNEHGGRVVRLEDCVPDVTATGLLNRLLAKADRLLLKASPLMDIDAAVGRLQQVEAVHVVAVQNEVKEILFIISRLPLSTDEVSIAAVNLTEQGDGPAVTFRRAEERAVPVTFGNPLRYLYEPNAALMKAGAFRVVAARYGLQKLAPHSHLYTTDALVWPFPGRVFDLMAVSRPDRKELRTVLPDLKANLTVRNFPQPAEELRKKLGLREGGDIFVLATSLLNGDKRLLITRKVTNVQSS